MHSLTTKSSMILSLFIPLLLRLVCAQDQIFLEDTKGTHLRIYNVSLNFDDLPTNDHGIGYHPTKDKQTALPYNSVYIQGLSVVDVSKAKLPDKSDISCALGSAPNALFGKHDQGYAWPRISLNDLSRPFQPTNGKHSKHVRRTFSLSDLRIKPTGIIKGKPGKAFASVQLTMIKLPPDPLEGHVNVGSTGADIFPGLLHGQPVQTARTIATLLAGFFPGTHMPMRLELRKWFGAEWADGMDVLEISSAYATLNETTNVWSEEPWEFCVDDVVLEVTERAVKKGNGYEQKAEEGELLQRTTRGGEDQPRVRYVLVKSDGTVAEEDDPDYQQFRAVMSRKAGA